MSNELTTASLVLVKDFDIQHKSVEQAVIAEYVAASFLEELKQLKAFKQKCLNVVVTSAEQVADIDNSKTAIPIVAKLRTSAEKKKKALKEESLRKGNALDAINNAIEKECKAIEEHLRLNATFVEREEQAKYRQIGEVRAKEMAHFGVALPIFEELGKMAGVTYGIFYRDEEYKYQVRLEGERIMAEKAKAEAKAQAAEREEQERIKAENARLQAENARLQEERNKALQAQQAEATKAQAEKDALAKAGTKAKMIAFASKVEAFEIPQIEGEEVALEQFAGRLVAFVSWARKKYE